MARRIARSGSILLPALVLCALNALKPVVVDDAAYLQYAHYIARAPLDPYGFTIHWYEHPQPANTVLAPPVFLYWLGLGVCLFGDSEVVLKWWLLPWCILMTASIHALARRFARPHAVAVTWMIALSPAVLPGLNFMLDVPALALSLAALASFVSFRPGVPTALLAGTLAGMAAQTKYTGILAMPTLLLAAVFARRPARAVRTAILAVLIAAAGFALWEVFTAICYGESHFLFHVNSDALERSQRRSLAWPLITLVGGVGLPVAMLGLLALGQPLASVAAAMLLTAIGLCAIALDPYRAARGWTPTAMTFGVAGLATAGIVALVALRDRSRRGRFLIAWLVLEILGYFVLTPWPAVRRVIGVVVVMTFIAARGAARARAPARQVWLVAVFGVVVGVGFQVIEIENACRERDAVTAVNDWLNRRDAAPVVWFVGYHGWRYYGEAAGWKLVDSDRSELMPGDWLVVPSQPSAVRRLDLSDSDGPAMGLACFSSFALGTQPWYYGTSWALSRREYPIMSVDVYRIRRPTRIASKPAPGVPSK